MLASVVRLTLVIACLLSVVGVSGCDRLPSDKDVARVVLPLLKAKYGEDFAMYGTGSTSRPLGSNWSVRIVAFCYPKVDPAGRFEAEISEDLDRSSMHDDYMDIVMTPKLVDDLRIVAQKYFSSFNVKVRFASSVLLDDVRDKETPLRGYWRVEGRVAATGELFISAATGIDSDGAAETISRFASEWKDHCKAVGMVLTYVKSEEFPDIDRRCREFKDATMNSDQYYRNRSRSYGYAYLFFENWEFTGSVDDIKSDVRKLSACCHVVSS